MVPEAVQDGWIVVVDSEDHGPRLQSVAPPITPTVMIGLKSISPLTLLRYTGMNIGLLAFALTGLVWYRMSLRTTLFQSLETRMRLASLRTFERMRQSNSWVAKATVRAGCLSVWSPSVAFPRVSDQVGQSTRTIRPSRWAGVCLRPPPVCTWWQPCRFCTVVISCSESNDQQRRRIGKDCSVMKSSQVRSSGGCKEVERRGEESMN